MRVEIVLDQDDFLRFREHFVAKEADGVSVVDRGAGGVFANKDFSSPQEGRTDHESAGTAFADILRILPAPLTILAYLSGRAWRQWFADLGEQLLAELVDADQGTLGIQR